MVEAKRVEDSLRRVANEKIKEAEQKAVDQVKRSRKICRYYLD